MPRGPQHQRLADFVANAHPESLNDASTQWKTGMGLLRQISEELKTRAGGIKAAESYSDGDVWSGATASTARDAFTHSSTAMHHKSNEMEHGADAFTAAAEGLRDARTQLAALDAADPGDKPTAPTFAPGPRSHADEVKQSHYDTSAANWQRDYHANEVAAGRAITHLQANHEEQSKVFRRIAGLPPREKPQPPAGGGNPVDTGSRPTVSNGSNPTLNNDTNTVVVVGDVTHPTDEGTNTHPGGDNTPPGGGTNPGGGIGTTPGIGTGVPQGPTTTSPIGTPGVLTGGGPGAAGGVGAAAGGAFGGVAAAGLAGGLSGGLSGLAPVGGGRGSLSSSGVRGIGATSRAGVGAGSVLGRGGGGRAGAGGMPSRTGGRNGGKARGATGRGSRGSAGARGAGAGAGRGGGKDKKRGGEDRDLFDDGQDWLDDEAQPGLID